MSSRSYLALICFALCAHLILSHSIDCGAGRVRNPVTRECECKPFTCAMLSWECGEIKDGCGGTIACGSCQGTDVCSSHGKCVQPGDQPEPQADGNPWSQGKSARSAEEEQGELDLSKQMNNPHYRQELRQQKFQRRSEQGLVQEAEQERPVAGANNPWAQGQHARSVEEAEEQGELDLSKQMNNPHFRQAQREARSVEEVNEAEEQPVPKPSQEARRQQRQLQQRQRQQYFAQQREAIDQAKRDVKPHPRDPAHFASAASARSQPLDPQAMLARQQQVAQQRHDVHQQRKTERHEYVQKKKSEQAQQQLQFQQEHYEEKHFPAVILYGLPVIAVCAVIAAAALFVHQAKQDRRASYTEDHDPLLQSSKHAITILPSPLLKAQQSQQQPPIINLNKTSKAKLMNSPNARRSPKISEPRLRSSQTFTQL